MVAVESLDAQFAPPPDAEQFFADSLRLLNESGIPYLLSGTYAVSAYTGLVRPTKDLDVFCKAGDYPKILKFFMERGYRTGVEDERWLAHVFQGKYFFDVIYNSMTVTMPITDEWFEGDYSAFVYGEPVKLTPPTQLIVSKCFVQDRYRFDGADIHHVILRKSAEIDWKLLLNYMELNWEVLLAHLLNFRFAYPSERECVPRWVMDELVSRLKAHIDMPRPDIRVCRGRLFSPRDYLIDITEWGFADVVGRGLEERHAPIE